MQSRNDAAQPIRIGVSTCILGEKVRFDGGHKEDRYLTRTLAPWFEWVPVCPEVELGLGIPREAIRLIRIGEETGMVLTKSGRDLTAEMRRFAKQRVAQLDAEGLGGFVLKSDSPSCGMERVRVYEQNGMPRRNGRGLFAKALLERFPDLPVEEEGRLCDPRLRENWIERVFAFQRLGDLWSKRWTVRGLIDFHTAHKLTVLAHSPKAYGELGRLVAGARELSHEELRRRYQSGFMSALRVIATRGRHANVLQHMAGYLRKQLDDPSRAELLQHIEEYRTGILPLIVPLTLINHHLRRIEVPYLQGQVYLSPHPRELALRNHV